MKKYLLYIFLPLFIPFILAYICRNIIGKKLIEKDLIRWRDCIVVPFKNDILTLCFLLFFYPEFRNLFYFRLGKTGYLLSVLLWKYSPLFIVTSKIGGGLFIQHGFSSIIYAKSIGDNCWINQNVTIGSNGKGIPTIGNNVNIGAGAILLGPIHVGNNVKIGAGAIVVNNIPDNCTVVSEKARIVKSV